MTKKSGITVIIGTWLLFNIHTAQAQLPTVDFGNLAGTIGIVTQGITNVQQGIEVITNGSNLNAIIGDAVGTISKFASTVKGYVQDAQQAIEKAKQRIQEGKELYNKYKGEIEERKAKYQALLASIPNYTNPNSYDDSSSNNSSSSENSSNNSSYSGNSSNNYSNQNSSYNNNNNGGTTSTTNSNRFSPQINNGGNNTPSVNNGRINSGQQNEPVINNGSSRYNIPTASDKDAEPVVTDSETLDEEVTLFEEEQEEAKKELPEEITKTPPAQQDGTNTQPIGRRAFGSPDTSEGKTTKEEPTIEKTVEPTVNEVGKTKESISKGVEALEIPSVSAPESKFRVSPSSDASKRSQNTITFSSRLAFAAETSNSNTGTGYDKNGVFIFNTKYCDKSVDDMLTEQGARECLVNIVNKINNKNSYYAASSAEDCKKMIFETAVALLAEATSIKYEASNYQDTLDEQESLGGNSNNTRDDTQVLAMNYEQTQKLLNKLTTLLSGETIFNITKEICGVSEKVLEPNEVDIDNGGK